MLRLQASRLFFAVDLLLGVAGGSRCPNCEAPGASNRLEGRRAYGLLSIRSCGACGILYRPSGWKGGKVLEFYYSLLYGNAGIATEPREYADEHQWEVEVSAAGKDRSRLLSSVLDGQVPRRLCVFGCSWGYELLPLRRLANEVVGVEISGPRREFGSRRLGLRIYRDVDCAAREGGTVDLVLSSHVLEHIPRLEATLDAIRVALQPSIQVHVTPNVDAAVPGSDRTGPVGREHPIGVSEVFWKRYAARHGFNLETLVLPDDAGHGLGERVAILRPSAGPTAS